MKILKKEVIIKKDEVWYNSRFIYLKKDSWNWTKDYVSFFLLKKSGVSFFYEKTFLLKYVMWIFPLSTTIHGSKINIKGRKKRWKSHSPPLFFIIFRERSYRQKKLFKKMQSKLLLWSIAWCKSFTLEHFFLCNSRHCFDDAIDKSLRFHSLCFELLREGGSVF